MAAILHVYARGLIFMKEKKKCIFQKENGNTFTLSIIIIVKSLQKEQIAQITYYEPQSAGINLQSPQSVSTPRRLTLVQIVDNASLAQRTTLRFQINEHSRHFREIS